MPPFSEPSLVVISPPVWVNAPLASMAVLPFPLQVRSSVPLETVRLPLESMQSPLETMVMLPPLMTISQPSTAANSSCLPKPKLHPEASAPPAAFRPSSCAVIALLQKNNYAADAVFDGEEALSYLEAGNYDAVILDIMMPKMDGLTVLRRIRERGSRIPVLLLTAKSEVEDKVLGLDSGANDYLTKPFATAELLARIRTMTRSQSAQLSSRLTFGNVCLDQTTFELSAPGGSCHLARKEFQILELLMHNPGQVIPTERFVERIWGYDSDVDVGVVWVYVSYLRKKLDALHADIRIKATRNAGYSLEVRP